MTGEPLSETIRELLESHLMQQLIHHVPDHERVDILSGGYWVGWRPSGRTYAGLDHELPVLTRPMERGNAIEIVHGTQGGVRVTNRVREIIGSGTWIDGRLEHDAESPPAES